MRHPMGRMPKSREEAQRNIDAMKGMMRGVKNYGKNVAGGAKIVGSAVKRGINKVGTKIADDLFGSAERDEKQREAGRALNRFWSGK